MSRHTVFQKNYFIKGWFFEFYFTSYRYLTRTFMWCVRFVQVFWCAVIVRTLLSACIYVKTQGLPETVLHKRLVDWILFYVASTFFSISDDTIFVGIGDFTMTRWTSLENHTGLIKVHIYVMCSDFENFSISLIFIKTANALFFILKEIL